MSIKTPEGACSDILGEYESFHLKPDVTGTSQAWVERFVTEYIRARDEAVRLEERERIIHYYFEHGVSATTADEVRRGEHLKEEQDGQ